MKWRRLVLLFSAVLVWASTSPALALAPSIRPTATPPATSPPATEPGLILVVVVIPVVLLALIWLGYIFWLIFHEGENVGSGAPPPREDPGQTPPNGRPEPPDQPGSVG